MLARPIELCQRGVDVVARRSILRRRVGGVERQCRRTGERRAHQRHRAEHVGPHQRAPRRDRSAEIVADHRRDRAMAECRDQPQRIPDCVQNAERAQIAIVIGVPARGAAIAALIGCDDVKAGSRERRHDLAPGIGDFRKTVQHQHAGLPPRFEAGLEHVHPQAVDVGHKTRAYARRQCRVVEWRQFAHASSPVARLTCGQARQPRPPPPPPRY